MIEKVKCPIHNEELELQSAPDGSRFAICICDTNGMLNRWHGVVVTYMKPKPVVEKTEEVKAKPLSESEPETLEAKRNIYKRSNK